MIERPISPESRRRPVLIVVALSIVLVAVLLAVGCTGQPDLIPPLVPISCPPTGNATPYIIINPIDNHYIGDVFEINGTTNLGPDKEIAIRINEPFFSGPHYSGPDAPVRPKITFLYIYDFVKTQPDTCGRIRWSFPVNLSEVHSNRVLVIVGNMTVYNQTDFTVSM